MPMNIRCRLLEGFRSVVDNGRGHSVVLDLPKDLGGTDTGPTALELCAMSLAGCIVTIFSLVAKKMRVDVEDLEVTMVAEKPEDAKTITSVTMEVKVRSGADEATVRKVWERTKEICPVGIIFEKAGVKLEAKITKL